MTNPNDPQRLDAPTVRRNRGTLLLIVGIFFGAMLLAGLLRFSGWRPAGLKTHGTLITPALDARSFAPVSTDGRQYAWNPMDRRWRLLVVNGASCEAACETLAADLDKVWQLLGREQDRVDVLWMGAAPKRTAMHQLIPLAADAPIRSVLPSANNAPTAKGLPVYIIDPNGFVMMQFAPGADVSGVRADLAKVLKLK